MSSKKSKAKSQKHLSPLEKNKLLNWDAFPANHVSNDPHAVGIAKFEIPIGAANPVQMFAQWCGNYWRPEGHQFDDHEETNDEGK